MIHECDKEDEDNLAQIYVRKIKKEGTGEIDIDEIEDKSAMIALYKKENDKQAISNKLQITIPGIFILCTLSLQSV